MFTCTRLSDSSDAIILLQSRAQNTAVTSQDFGVHVPHRYSFPSPQQTQRKCQVDLKTALTAEIDFDGTHFESKATHTPAINPISRGRSSSPFTCALFFRLYAVVSPYLHGPVIRVAELFCLRVGMYK